MSKLIEGCYHSYIKKTSAVGWCKFHKFALTPKQIKLKHCLDKQCKALVRYEKHPYWLRKAEIKKLRKQRKERLKSTYFK